MKLKNKVAIITGAAQGIGLACAGRFIAEGAKVIITDVLDDAGSAEAKRMGATYLHCDVSKSGDVKTVITAVVKQFGGIDILMNNAGISISGDFLEISEADYDKVIDINLKGSFLMLQACAREMVAQVAAGKPAGSIVNMSSVNDTLAIPTIVSYCIAKGGISQLTRATSIYLAPYGIRVNAIGPGSIMTDMLKSIVSDRSAMNRVMSRTPMARIGEPSEIASIAVFLASDDSSYVTGQTIYADGGRMPLNYTVPVKE
jgi:glucose 1-dehydrogenase